MFYVYSERSTLVVTDSKPYNKTKIERARPRHRGWLAGLSRDASRYIES
jgi:hypothetical protein